MAIYGAEAGFSQVSVMKMTSGVWVVIVSQISDECLPSERALSRMQWSLPVALVASGEVSVGVLWMMLFAVVLMVVALVLQVKWRLRQEKGPLVVFSDTWLQLLWRPGFRAWSSVVE